jgi:O-antigen ligase
MAEPEMKQPAHERLDKVREIGSPLLRFLEGLVIFVSFMLVNTNAFIRFRQFPDVYAYSDNELNYIAAAIITLFLIGYLLRRNNLLTDFLQAWRKSVFLVAFLAFALVSMLWSVYPAATSYKLVFLFFSTLAGSYLAIRYGIGGFVRVLEWVGGVCVVISLLFVFFVPSFGVMQNETFHGSWTGIFWHRNHAGNLFAFFNMVFLFRLLSGGAARRIDRFPPLLFYVLTALMVFGSRSATGVIVFLFLHVVVVSSALWLQIESRLRPRHYYLVGGLLLAGFVVFITNTGFFFGLLDRTPTMTGRLPLWQDLFASVYLKKPVIGYGYGALWMLQSFRIEMQVRHNWLYQVYFADNGFFDILLQLGWIGLVLFAGVYIPAGIRSLRRAASSKSWIFFFPLFTFLYIFIGNLTYSFLLEVDQFVWMALVAVAFLANSATRHNNAQP